MPKLLIQIYRQAADLGRRIERGGCHMSTGAQQATAAAHRHGVAQIGGAAPKRAFAGRQTLT